MAPAEMIEMLRLAARQRETRFDIELRLSKLTRRELEVLRLLAEGLGDSEIADRLSISTETVRVHMPKMLGKLGVNSRLQALIFAWKAGVSRPYIG
jgi:DNA-binding NarL/FixJ family response regulator